MQCLKAVDDPLEAVLVLVAGQRRLHAAVGHQVVKILAGSPGAGLHADVGDAELVRQLEIADGHLDVFLLLVGVGGEEGLMGGHAVEIEPADECGPLELLEIGMVAPLHLPLENLQPREAPLGGQIEILLQVAQRPVLELPECIAGQADAVGVRLGALSGITG